MFSGKCLGKDTPVLMYDGSIKKVQDVVCGDQLMGDDSTPRNVLSTCSGESNLYRITPSWGDSYVVNENHILSLKCSITIVKWQVIDISVQDYLKERNLFRTYYKGYRVGVDFPEIPFEIDPYILGTWLGDGTSKEASITSMDKEIIEYWQVYADQIGLMLKENPKEDNNNKASTYRVTCGQTGGYNWLLSKLKELNLYGNKHVPLNYKANSRHIRLAVLAGLIDTDGHYDEGKQAYEITQKLEVLADDICYLARSLGFVAYKNKCEKITGEYFRVHLCGNNLCSIPCLLERKKSKKTKARTDLLVGITVEEIGRGDYYGFTVDANHRFLLGDFTVTHNSSDLFRRLNRAKIADQKTILYKYGKDTRYDDDMSVASSHDGIKVKDAVPVYSFANIEVPTDVDVIGIDEGQFIDDIERFAMEAASRGIHVIIAGLDADYQMKPFERIVGLVPKAERVIKLHAVCNICKGEATFTKRIDTNDTSREVIGGADKYVATCRSCFSLPLK
jgi:replicative DNA helicase